MGERKQNISLLSLNVRGIRDKPKRSKIMSWIKHQRTDIIMLQETFLTCDLENVIKMECNYHCYFNHGTNHSKGVVILVNKIKPIEPLEHFVHFDGRVVAVRIIYDEISYFILNVYAPTKRNEKEAFYKQLSRWLKKVKRVNDSLVLGGDWNCVQNASIDTRGMAYAYREVKKFKKLQKRFHLIDAWRKMFPFRKQYTWRQLHMNICSRLDFWLITDTLLSCVQTTEIKPVPICDHCAITLRLTTTSNSKGGGIWKMNNSLLKDDDYKEKIKTVIKKFMLENYQMNAQVKWDMCKAKIKEYTVKFSKEKHVENNQIFKHLQNEYTEMSKNR